MQAVTHDRYTGPEGLKIIEQPTPEITADRVLIKVARTGLNALDWHMYRAEPALVRIQAGLRVKEPRRIGVDFAGTVEAIGANVTTVVVGDRVMASHSSGGSSELAISHVSTLTKIPDNVSFESAAATPVAGLTALQALRDKARLSSGETVLVWGASGGVGHLAVQIAKGLGAGRVDGVCSTSNIDMVSQLGADNVYDYTTDNDRIPEATYDVIIDTVSTQPMRHVRKLLKPGGRWIAVGSMPKNRVVGTVSVMIGRQIAAKVLGVDARGILAKTNAEDLKVLADMLSNGILTPVVAETYSLGRTSEACQRLEAGHVAGKLLIDPTT
jgi:NADPH:quinone reductase-like Zn-dependent oxidoreductase